MEIDLGAISSDLDAVAARLRSQVCIIGGGIAGLMLANLLKDTCTVTLLEAGGHALSPAGRTDPFEAELRGVPHTGTRDSRVAAFGGTSLTWGGQLLGIADHAEWPIEKEELQRGNRLWHVPENAAAFLATNGAQLPDLLRAFPEMQCRLSRFVPFGKRNLAKRPGKLLLRVPSVNVVLHAAVVELELAPTREQITAAKVVTRSGRSFRIGADQFVLCAGTVETCRLLLASRSVAAEGVGNGFGQVGKNFHDHLTLPAAVFSGQARTRVLEQLRPWVFQPKRQSRSVYSLKLEPSGTLCRELGITAGMAHVTVTEPENSGVGALRGLLQARQQGRLLAASVGALKRLPEAAGKAAKLAWEARTEHRRYVSPEATVQLQLNIAQDAPSMSQIRLSPERDERGMPRAVVDWRVSAGELAGLRRFAAHLRAGFECAGMRDGIAWEPALFSEGTEADEHLLARLDDARHAMGGASMGTDPETSVVDPELRVHGMRNLSVASPAVFPDGAAQLPTLTLSALCLRLADRLQAELAR